MKRFLLALVFLLLPTLAHSTTWYAGIDGSNSNDCTQAQTHATRKLTVAAGLACMTSAGGGGHTLYITAGTYNETGLSVPSGTSIAHNTIRSYSTDNVIFTNTGLLSIGPFNLYNTGKEYIDFVGTCTTGLARTCTMTFDNSPLAFDKTTNSGSQHITFDGIRIHNVVVGGGITSGVAVNIASDNITFRNCRIDNNGTTPDGEGQAGYAFYIGGSNNLVEKCELDNSGGYAIHQYSGDQTPSNNTYRYNFIHDNGQLVTGNVADGILLSGAGSPSANAAYSNLIWNNARGYGIRLNTCASCLVYNNTIYNNGADVGADGIYIQSATNASIINNIVSNNAVNQILNTGTGTSFAANLCSASGTGCALVEAASATFNTPGSDFTLKTGSQAFDAGVTLGAPYNTDILAEARPQGAQFDLGAYETLSPPGGCPSAPNPNSLVRRYDFDGVATDSSGNGVTATLGAGVTYTTGKYGQGLLMPADAGVTVPDADDLDFCDGFTFEAWISVPSVSSDSMFIVKNPDSKIFLGQVAGFCNAAVRPLGGYSQGANAVVCQDTALTTSTFTHLAVTYNGAVVTLYKNGVSVGTPAAGTELLNATTGTLQFCNSSFGEFCPSGTILDEVRIYNYARSAGQIVADMDAPQSPGSGTLYISWTDNASDETHYEIERGTEFAGTFAHLADGPANIGEYRDTQLVVPQQYCYRVRARVSGGADSAYSEVKCQRPTALPAVEELASGFSKPIASTGTATVASGNATPTNLSVRQ